MKSLFVSNGNFGHVNVAELTPPSYGLTATISKGLSGPEGLAFDASGNLFVANSSGIEGVNQGTVTVYAPTSGALVATITNSVVEPTFVAFDARGNLFVANVGNDTVTEYAPPCSGAPIATISNSLSGPEGLAFDASGNLFVANPTPYLGGIGTVDEYTPPYTGTPTEIGDVLSVNGPQGLAFGP